GDPLLSVEQRALHARKPGLSPYNFTPTLASEVLAKSQGSTATAGAAPECRAAPDAAVTAEAATPVRAAPGPSLTVEARTTSLRDAHATRRAALAKTRQSARATARRRWRLVPRAGAAGAIAAGLGAGSAVAFVIAQG